MLANDDMSSGRRMSVARPSRIDFAVTEACNLAFVHCITFAPPKDQSATVSYPLRCDPGRYPGRSHFCEVLRVRARRRIVGERDDVSCARRHSRRKSSRALGRARAHERALA